MNNEDKGGCMRLVVLLSIEVISVGRVAAIVRWSTGSTGSTGVLPVFCKNMLIRNPYDGEYLQRR